MKVGNTISFHYFENIVAEPPTSEFYNRVLYFKLDTEVCLFQEEFDFNFLILRDCCNS